MTGKRDHHLRVYVDEREGGMDTPIHAFVLLATSKIPYSSNKEDAFKVRFQVRGDGDY